MSVYERERERQRETETERKRRRARERERKKERLGREFLNNSYFKTERDGAYIADT